MAHEERRLDDHVGGECTVTLRAESRANKLRLFRDARSCDSCAFWIDCSERGEVCGQYNYQQGVMHDVESEQA